MGSTWNRAGITPAVSVSLQVAHCGNHMESRRNHACCERCAARNPMFLLMALRGNHTESRRNHACCERCAEGKPMLLLVAHRGNHMESRRNHACCERFAEAKPISRLCEALQESRGITQESRYFEGSLKQNTHFGVSPGH